MCNSNTPYLLVANFNGFTALHLHQIALLINIEMFVLFAG